MAAAAWILLPLLVVHLVLLRRPRALAFQLLFDLVLIALFAVPLIHGRAFTSIRVLEAHPPFHEWPWSDATTVRPDHSDLVIQYHPWWEAVRRRFGNGDAPLIAPTIGAGVPLVANGQSGALAPFMLPTWLSGPEVGSTVATVWKVEAAALGSYLLLAGAWRMRWPAAAVGGMAFGISPWVIGWLLSPLGWAAAILPWSWWLVHVVMRRRESWRRALLAGVLLGWFLGCGLNPEYAAIVTGSALLYGLVIHPRRVLRLAVVGATAAIVGVALGWPTLGLLASSSKVLTYQHENPNLQRPPWDLRWEVALQTAVPALHGHPRLDTWLRPYPWAPAALGIGGAALALAAAAPWRPRHRRLAAAALTMLAVVAVLVFRLPPLDALLVRIPPLDRMTLPRFAMLAPWGLTLLAAVGVEGAVTRGIRPWAWALSPMLGLVVLAVGPPGAMSGWLLALSTPFAAAAALVLLRFRRRWAPALVGAELLLLGVGVVPVAAAADVLPAPAPIPELQQLLSREPGRILALGPILPANTASRYGLADLRAFDPVRPWPLARLHALLGAHDPVLPGLPDRAPAALCGAWSVRWLLTGEGFAAPGWERVLVRNGVTIWRNPAWQPEVRAVTSVLALPEECGWELLNASPEALRTTVVVPEGTPQVGPGPVEVEVVEDRPEALVLRVRSASSALVAVARAWAPGWSATVNGQPAPLVRANLAGLGVVVPAGEHVAELRYRAWSWAAGPFADPSRTRLGRHP